MEDENERAYEVPTGETKVPELDPGIRDFKSEIDDLKNADINRDNIEKWYERAKGSISMAESHIRATIADVEKKQSEIADLKKRADVVTALKRKLVPMQLMTEERTLRFHFEKLFAWNRLEKQYLQMFVAKILMVINSFEAMGFDSKVIEAKKELAMEYKSQFKEMLQMVKDILTSKIESEYTNLTRRINRIEDKVFGATIQESIRPPVKNETETILEPPKSEPKPSVLKKSEDDENAEDQLW